MENKTYQDYLETSNIIKQKIPCFPNFPNMPGSRHSCPAWIGWAWQANPTQLLRDAQKACQTGGDLIGLWCRSTPSGIEMSCYTGVGQVHVDHVPCNVNKLCNIV